MDTVKIQFSKIFDVIYTKHFFYNKVDTREIQCLFISEVI